MSEPLKVTQGDRMKEYWRQVKAGIVPPPKKRGKTMEATVHAVKEVKGHLVEKEVSPEFTQAVEQQDQATVTVTPQPAIVRSPFCPTKPVEWPMPTLSPTVEHIAPEEQQPMGQAQPKPVAHPLPRPTPQQASQKQAWGNVNVVQGRKVAVKFVPPKQAEPRKVIVALGRKLV